MEEEFKLPLRHWLKKQVDSKKFYGLDWANSEKTLIKIPWIQQHYPGWEQSYQLFIVSFSIFIYFIDNFEYFHRLGLNIRKVIHFQLIIRS